LLRLCNHPLTCFQLGLTVGSLFSLSPLRGELGFPPPCILKGLLLLLAHQLLGCTLLGLLLPDACLFCEPCLRIRQLLHVPSTLFCEFSLGFLSSQLLGLWVYKTFLQTVRPMHRISHRVTDTFADKISLN
jgi:hypothetical protein